MSIIDEIFERQKANNSNWHDFSNMPEFEKEQATKDFILLAMDELVELLRETNYKRHIIYRKPTIRDNIVEEIIDVFKYLLCIALLHGVTPDEFVEKFMVKSDLVDVRWRMEKAEWTGNLLCVDIDGVLADYINGYEGFLCTQDILMKYPCDQSTYSLAERFGIDKAKEEDLKRKFQEQGGFKKLPIFRGAVDTLQWAKELGYKIILISARPYAEIKRIHTDTVWWLENNGVPYDALFWGRDKADIVFSKLHPVIPTWFIEDRDKHAIELANEGIPVLLMDKPYNHGVTHKNITRVRDWYEVGKIIAEV